MRKLILILTIILSWSNISIAECISGDCINGRGTFYSEYGDKYVGEWKDGKEHGQGISTWKNGTEYVGEFKDGLKNGQGTLTYQDHLTYPDGTKYVGEWKEGYIKGQGAMTYPDGTKLVGEFGEFNDGKPNGQVTYIFPDGGKWVGEFKGGYFNGQGTNIFLDKKNYAGEYKDDKRNGQGTYIFSSETKCVGEWKDDKPNGQGTFIFPNGDKYVGEWKDGKYNGQGTYIFTDGTKYIVKWKDGKRHGVATKIHPNGAKYIVEFKDGKEQPKKKHTLNTSELYDWIKNQTEHVSANAMILDDRFTDLLETEIPNNNIYLGMSRGEKAPLIDSLLKVLNGPPDELIYSGDKTYMTTSACRHQSCTEKGFVFIDTEKKFTIGLIRHFFINDDKNEKSFDEGDFLIFSKTHNSFDEIPKFFIQSVEDWIVNRSHMNNPPYKVRFIGSDNKINEVENVFNN